MARHCDGGIVARRCDGGAVARRCDGGVTKSGRGGVRGKTD